MIQTRNRKGDASDASGSAPRTPCTWQDDPVTTGKKRSEKSRAQMKKSAARRLDLCNVRKLCLAEFIGIRSATGEARERALGSVQGAGTAVWMIGMALHFLGGKQAAAKWASQAHGGVKHGAGRNDGTRSVETERKKGKRLIGCNTRSRENSGCFRRTAAHHIADSHLVCIGRLLLLLLLLLPNVRSERERERIY
jgi:hypothetical protein